MPDPLALVFADHLLACRQKPLPAAALEKARASTLDTLGVILGATALEPSSQAMLDLVLEARGTPQASLLGTRHKIPAPAAAFANGAFAHCLDFDDHAPEGHHPSSSIIPVCLALAERKGDVSGRTFLQAVTLGQDLFMRLRRNVVWQQDWHLTTVIAVFSATAAGAALLGLSREAIASAFGIAGIQASGTYELVQGVNNEVRGYYAGFVSQQAINAVLLAERGVKGPHSIFDGKAGFFNVYFDGKYDRAVMLDALGERFQGEDLLYKPWPSCGLSHSYIHAARKLMADHDVTPETLKHVKIFAGNGQMELCQPLEMRIKPKTSADAKFSIPYTLAVTFQRGTVTPRDFLPGALKDPQVLSLALKMEPVADSTQGWDSHLPLGRIEVELHDGRRIEVLGEHVPGSTEAPMTWAELVEKYIALAREAEVGLSVSEIARSVEMIAGLEDVKDMSDLADLLSGRLSKAPRLAAS